MGFEKTRLPHTIINVWKYVATDFNYLKYDNSGRKADACMKSATIDDSIAIYNLSIHQLLGE